MRLGIHTLGLTKEDWYLGKDQIFERYQKVLNKFTPSFPQESKLKPSRENQFTDQIEASRSKNNLNWMNILRPVWRSPVREKALVQDIRRIDGEISDLTVKLVSL